MVVNMRIDNSFIAASRLGTTLEPLSGSKNESEKKGIAGGFEKIFDDLWKASSEASAASRAETAKLLINEQDDLPMMQVTGEKSSILFELNLTVRQKVIDAYTEIMKTGV
jgi:flagellar hook-basal body complex protein FliE